MLALTITIDPTPAQSWPRVLLSLSPRERQRPRDRRSKGEPFITRERYEWFSLASANWSFGPAGAESADKGKEAGERQHRPRPTRTRTAARRAPRAAAGRSEQGTVSLTAAQRWPIKQPRLRHAARSRTEDRSAGFVVTSSVVGDDLRGAVGRRWPRPAA